MLRGLLIWHLNLALGLGVLNHPVTIVGRKRVLSQDLAATSNSEIAFLSFA